MNDIENKFTDYIKSVIAIGVSSNDKLIRSRYFNSKVDEFYLQQLKLNPNMTRVELVIILSQLRVRYQVEFVGI